MNTELGIPRSKELEPTDFEYASQSDYGVDERGCAAANSFSERSGGAECCGCEAAGSCVGAQSYGSQVCHDTTPRYRILSTAIRTFGLINCL